MTGLFGHWALGGWGKWGQGTVACEVVGLLTQAV